MSKVYFADKSTLDRVSRQTDLILAQLMVLNNDSTAKTQAAANYFNTTKTGKTFGVSFNDFGISSSPSGTRLYDAKNMIARPSTDSVADRNDFDAYSIFNGLTVNGYVGTDGEFVVTYFEGENGFSKTNADVYVLFGTSYIKIDITSQGETICITDKPKDGYFTMPGAVRTDGSIRPFVPIAKYFASAGSDNKPSSTSGKTAYHDRPSYTNCRTDFYEKGTQYCSTTMQDRFLIETLFQVVFATRNSQSIMAGCTSYSYSYQLQKAENNVSRVIITTANAANLVVNSYVNVGAQDSRNASGYMIISIEEVTIDGTTYATVNLDTGDATLITTTEQYVTTLPWRTGACDNVMGTCGSPVNNTNGKYPCIFFGVEMFIGMYEVIGNAIYKQESGTGHIYVCYDSTNLSTAITDNYTKVNTDIPGGFAAWKYQSVLGFDKNNPGCRVPSELNATSANGYCDGVYTPASDGSYEVLAAGVLNSGSCAGLWTRNLLNSLSSAHWAFSSRLSATGRCGVEVAA